MPKAGDVIENPITTDRIIFRKTWRDTNGELLQFDNYHKPGGIGPNPHFHPLQEETFEVVEGTFGITRNGQEQFLNSGEKAIISKRPRKSNAEPSPAQMAQRERFSLANAYARAALADPDLGALYQERAANQGKSAFALARTDYFNGKDFLSKK
ncbi:MAG TPA: hypothetical protein VMN99_06605 [Anaerolineales bacterium]|nr:hypothetical protein [Anaerolineales bacterium]